MHGMIEIYCKSYAFKYFTALLDFALKWQQFSSFHRYQAININCYPTYNIQYNHTITVLQCVNQVHNSSQKQEAWHNCCTFSQGAMTYHTCTPSSCTLDDIVHNRALLLKHNTLLCEIHAYYCNSLARKSRLGCRDIFTYSRTSGVNVFQNTQTRSCDQLHQAKQGCQLLRQNGHGFPSWAFLHTFTFAKLLSGRPNHMQQLDLALKYPSVHNMATHYTQMVEGVKE